HDLHAGAIETLGINSSDFTRHVRKRSFKKQGWPLSHLSHGIWFLVFMGFLAVMSWLGTYGGRHLIAAPWDSLGVAAGALVLWAWGVASGLPIEQALMGGRQMAGELRVQEPELSSFDQNL
ncbi:MAG: hypothetical protein C7B47_16080, partial [Sulfobacillus thermosulfidooxidans]